MKRALGAWKSTALLVGALALPVGVQAAPMSAAQATDLAAELAAQGNTVATHRLTGRVIFVGAGSAKSIDSSLPTATLSSLPQTRSAMDYMNLLAPAFGLANPEVDARVAKVKSSGRVQHTRYQQTHNGLPVLAGELLVNQDAVDSNLLSMSGRTAPNLAVGTIPTITAETALQISIPAVAKWHGVNPNRLTVTRSELSIFVPALIDGAGDGPARLVWRLEVASLQLDPVREFVLIDALTGDVALHFNQIHEARNRTTFDTNSTATLPGTLVCNEGQSTCGGITDAANAHLFAADTYDYYMSHFGRDSINGSGLTIISTTRYCPTPASCPYANAFWDGTQMVYGAGYASADDVVGHELTHGVTQYESGLYYYYQSGAINEALSDIFGEFVDQANGRGTDTPAVKWLLGEDLIIGAIRNMSNPPAFGHPDKMTSANYNKLSGDNGGVHTNSGIANKAAFLMADGGTFNGQTVVALGNDKTAAIWYEANKNLLFSGADYLDLYNALFQACQNLVGTAGIVIANCTQVRKATDAVEMNLQPAVNFLPEALVCPAGQSPVNAFFDTFEAGNLANWTAQGAISDLNANTIWFVSNQYATSPPMSLFGRNTAFGPYDASLSITAPILIPPNAFLRMEHAFGFEFNGSNNFDGGFVESSINNGSSWQQMTPESGQAYNGTIINGFNNPLAGKSAFVNVSHGYVSTRFSLSALSGQSARFRFRIGADDAVSARGWFIDNVRVYTCAVPQVLQFASATLTIGEAGGNATIAVNRTGATTGTVSVMYGTSDGTATAGADYTTTNGTLTFGPGVSTQNVIVPIINDTDVESSENFTVTLSNPTGSSLGATITSTVTITDNDVLPPQSLRFASPVSTVSEGDGNISILVQRTGGTTGSVSVNYTTANGTATAGSDYTTTSGVLTFGAGVSTQNIVVPITNDAVVEPSKTFTVTLSNPSVATIGSPGTTTVTIVDDDTLTLTVLPLGTGGGGISSNVAGISCGGDCSEAYARNTQVTLSASPFPGSTFGGWGGACAGTGACNVTMTAATNVTASFVFIGTVSSYDFVQKAYVAYYGRAADPPGQAYWAGRVDDAGGSISAIIDAYGNSPEFNTRYGGLSYAALVTLIYQQALGRDPDAGGLAFYVGELQAGRRTLQSITLDVLNGATTPPDSIVVANKLEVAAYYTLKVTQGCPYGTELDGVTALVGVTASPATVIAAKAAIDLRCAGP